VQVQNRSSSPWLPFSAFVRTCAREGRWSARVRLANAAGRPELGRRLGLERLGLQQGLELEQEQELELPLSFWQPYKPKIHSP